MSLAKGNTLKQAATECGYTFEAVSRLSQRPHARAELLRLRAEAEMELARALPELIAQAVEVLKGMLMSSNFTSRRDAAFYVLKYLAPEIQQPTLNATDTGAIIEGNTQNGFF